MTLLSRTIRVVGSLLIAGAVCESSSAQESSKPVELAARVRSIFLAKCTECHGRSLSRPRAGLYLHELGPLASNREWVVPFEPEKSYVWSLVRDDDMPAKGAQAGPLNAQEKKTIRAWIAAGAPVPPVTGASPQASPAEPSPISTSPADAPVSPSWTAFPFGWLGRFHVVVIHFPIALFAVAALGEILATRRSNIPAPAVQFCIRLEAAGAIAAVALGWLHADLGGYGSAAGGTLVLHRWLDTAAGVWAAVVVLVSERDSQRGQRSPLLRILLLVGAVLVASAAHFGGVLVHGSSFFEWS